MPAHYIHPRGADLAFTAQWLDTETGLPIPLTGLTLMPFEVRPAALADDIRMIVTDGPAGIFSVTCQWSSNWPDGIGHLVDFRAQASNGALLSINIPVQLI